MRVLRNWQKIKIFRILKIGKLYVWQNKEYWLMEHLLILCFAVENIIILITL